MRGIFCYLLHHWSAICWIFPFDCCSFKLLWLVLFSITRGGVYCISPPHQAVLCTLWPQLHQHPRFKTPAWADLCIRADDSQGCATRVPPCPSWRAGCIMHLDLHSRWESSLDPEPPRLGRHRHLPLLWTFARGREATGERWWHWWQPGKVIHLGHPGFPRPGRKQSSDPVHRLPSWSSPLPSETHLQLLSICLPVCVAPLQDLPDITSRAGEGIRYSTATRPSCGGHAGWRQEMEVAYDPRKVTAPVARSPFWADGSPHTSKPKTVGSIHMTTILIENASTLQQIHLTSSRAGEVWKRRGSISVWTDRSINV